LSKNKKGYASALILVILLSQSKFFNFLIDTPLGRSILVLFIIFISYTNKILGVVSVLFIIIIFNNSDIGYLEGFASSDSPSEDVKQKKMDNTNAQVPSATPTTAEAHKPSTTPLPTTNDNVNSSTSSNETATATEGFDIVGKERYMQKGNQSNQIPVNDFMRISEDVSPYETSSFSNTFTSY
jgi:cell division septation protein DedD